MSKFDLETIKAAALGSWHHILPTITGINPDLLDGKSHPCPNPSCPNGPGHDRFTCRDIHVGRLFCRYCNATGPLQMDGFGAVQWLTGMSFPEAIEAVAELLGFAPQDVSSPKRPLIELVAMSKGVRVEELRRYGATEATRKDDDENHPVVRFPLYQLDASGELVPGSYFDLGTATSRLRKGKAAYNRPPGLFLPSVLKDGKQILWTPTPNRPVYLTEGVKDAAKLLELGYPTVGLPYTSLPKEMFALFRGMHVYLVPDRDVAGIRGANKTAALLHGIAKEIHLVHLPSPVKPKDGDGVREIARRVNGPKDIRAAIDMAVRWSPEASEEHVFISLPQAAISWLEKQQLGEAPLRSTGIEPLDAAIGGGYEQGEIIIVGARPSHGKSALALALAEAQARDGQTCLFISEEMEPWLLGKRWLSSITDKPLKDYDPRELVNLIHSDHSEMDRILIAPKLQKVERAAEAMEHARQNYGATLCVIDYAQLLDTDSRFSRYDKVTEISKQITQAAKRTGMSTIVLCQLSRECEKRGYPQSVDLKESGQFEQDADVILLLWYKYMLTKVQEDRNRISIYCSKNRNRGLAPYESITLDFFPDRMRFADPKYREALEYADELSFEQQALFG